MVWKSVIDFAGKIAERFENENREAIFPEYFFRIIEIILSEILMTTMSQNLLVPIFSLPPLAEQHRIVAKVDAIMKLCDTLEARLKERAAAVGTQVAGGVR